MAASAWGGLKGNKVKALKDFLSSKEGLGPRAVTGFSGYQCILMLMEHERFSKELETHPQYKDIIILLNCLRTLSRISRTRFNADSELITEFENTVATLREVVTRCFSGRKGVGNIDKGGFVLKQAFMVREDGAITPLLGN